MKMVMWGHTKPVIPAPIQIEAEEEMEPSLLGHLHGARDLEQPDRNEEPAGQVDDGVHAGMAVTDHEEAEDHGKDAPDEIPAPHLLELRAQRVANGHIVVGELIGHGHDFPLGE